MPPGLIRQDANEPSFADSFWSLPTRRDRAGRLLVVGGHQHRFDQVQAIYQLAEAVGIGSVKAALPDTLRPVVSGAEFGILLPASPSGSIGKAALGELLRIAADFDALIVGANLTNNAETGMLAESLLRQTDAKVVVAPEAIEILKFHPELITGNPAALVVTPMAGLFALANHHRMPITLRPGGGIGGKLEILQQLVAISRCDYLVFDGEVLIAADNKLGLSTLQASWSQQQSAMTALAATFWLQLSGKPFEALMSAAFIAAQLTKVDLASTPGTASALRSALAQRL